MAEKTSNIEVLEVLKDEQKRPVKVIFRLFAALDVTVVRAANRKVKIISRTNYHGGSTYIQPDYFKAIIRQAYAILYAK